MRRLHAVLLYIFISSDAPKTKFKLKTQTKNEVWVIKLCMLFKFYES